MRVPVRCTACGFSHRTDLRDLQDDLLVCPICEHEAKLPDEQEVAELEQLEARRRLLTVLGTGAFFLGVLLTAGYAGFSESHPGDPMYGAGLLVGAGVLALVGLVLTVMQEAKASANYF